MVSQPAAIHFLTAAIQRQTLSGAYEHYTRKIEALKSEIDLTYNKIHSHKEAKNREGSPLARVFSNLVKDCLGLEPEKLIPRDAQCPSLPVERLKKPFFQSA